MNIREIIETAVEQLKNDGVHVCCDIDEDVDIDVHCEVLQQYFAHNNIDFKSIFELVKMCTFGVDYAYIDYLALTNIAGYKLLEYIDHQLQSVGYVNLSEIQPYFTLLQKLCDCEDIEDFIDQNYYVLNEDENSLIGKLPTLDIFTDFIIDINGADDDEAKLIWDAENNRLVIDNKTWQKSFLLQKQTQADVIDENAAYYINVIQSMKNNTETQKDHETIINEIRDISIGVMREMIEIC